MEYNLNYWRKNGRSQHVTGWPWVTTPLGSQPIMHAQKCAWTLDAGHEDNLNGGMF